ncbi:MAG: DUF423 domain-containing protein [Flavobacteriales bacterium]|nr:DUF423 domain-containing protein [Flavobacteriales bacterium]
MMTHKFTLKLAALFGALSVMIGAFGAHGLKELLLANQRLDVFEKAITYQFYHTLVLFLVAILMKPYASKYLCWSARFFVFGILIFSGSLYVLALTNHLFIGAITPVGGVFFILGWLSLFRFAYMDL